MRYIKIFILILASSLLLFSCTKLDETFQGDATEAQVGSGGTSSVDALLKATYASMQFNYQDQGNVFAMTEMTTDELIAPTRGPDWDDNGVWRVLHAHKWDADNVHIRDCFTGLLGTTFSATDLLRFNPTTQQAAEARFLRAFCMFTVLDCWDQVPYRDPGESTLNPSRVRKGTEALDYIITEVEAIKNDLPDGPASKANKWAARVLLMKCYLNKGAIANRAAPTFDNADMQKVIDLANEIAGAGKFSIATNYFDNFAPANGSISTENIYTEEMVGGQSKGGTGNNVRSRWHLTMHYNQNPSGWNGFTTLSDFYGKFDATDQRRGIAYNDGSVNPGKRVNVGFLVGQQYNLTTDAPLNDQTGQPLAFTPQVQSVETGTNLEVTGIRVNKYPIDYANDNSGNVDNDYVYYRYSDVLLMKAEAMLRMGDASGVTLVNQIRAARGVAPLGTLTLDNLLDERGRELYWEEYRRNDLIRFGKFLTPWQEKPDDDPKYLLLAIPNQQLAVNPNLKQNPGY
ncbi:RagB/SusD family nutrient uptake outer membrane protein [Deminuibacter soli]|uniref:RagB/SusD family nutrient uptake outer membrane protein n=1 Tax=Deminuibacter soli TaxID=2291815 RepID=A0A3E1ND45_9BACT|nr:RagB/SusD family nutrient uptake outer membrane protein [Deminuibacter soli]RFM25929.1 RagB/SusD family nutrient uptake outer membrane protein [Deminuibacter soli]